MPMRFEPMTYQGVVFDSRPLSVPPLGEVGPLPATEFHPWDDFLTPVDDQGQWGTCVCQGVSRVIETMILLETGRRVQLDAERLYRLTWEIEHKRQWPGDRAYDDGLMISSALLGAVASGLLRPEARQAAIRLTPAGYVDGLRNGPLLLATCVNERWRNPPPETGEIVGGPPVTNGHMTVATAFGWGAGGEPMVRGVNSWGGDWGHHGFFQMAWRNFLAYALYPPFNIDQAPGWYSESRTWEGWIVGEMGRDAD